MDKSQIVPPAGQNDQWAYSAEARQCFEEPDRVLTQADWHNAYQVQDACNLSGVLYSMVEALKRVRAEAAARRLGWDWASQHPIMVLYLDKVHHLMQTQPLFDNRIVDQAYDILFAKGGQNA